MARARNIKPAFFNNDELAEINPLGRLLFIGLWTLADYKGELEWREKRIKAQLLPYDNCDIKKLAINLDKSGFVRFYSDGDKIYLHVNNFTKHQNPHKNEREKGSEIPSLSQEWRETLDISTLTINRDKSGLKREDYETNPADSFNLIPDSLNPNPSNPQSVDDRFSEFWDLYGKKTGRDKCEKKWGKLKQSDIELIFAKLPLYVASTPDKQYRKDPYTWLNGKHWQDEIETSQKQSNHDLSGRTYESGVL